ncbi:hypothetical protein [Saccharophagus degradans]|uniref:hypothetical protein n=1 Tax=Saccharophagus degradans TaxID=86304 RepID=UPI0026E46299|nr:hypothetical protein [Saccharophagus degradans]MDO6607752.1 hypothetical protein [Saccharophagus degradans]
MKIYLSCYKCNHQKKYPSTLVDNGIYELACDNGHKISICLQQTKFEQLYEISLNAILDGYFREAVASMNAAIERFYEFYIEFVMTENKRGDTFNDAWSRVSSQSERQLGAYIFLYTIKNNRLPPLLSNNKVSFRNSVVHKGEFPTADKTTDFCKSATDVIVPVLKEMKGEWDIFRDVRIKDMTEKYEAQPLNEDVQLESPISCLKGIEHGATFEQTLKVLAGMRNA